MRRSKEVSRSSKLRVIYSVIVLEYQAQLIFISCEIIGRSPPKIDMNMQVIPCEIPANYSRIPPGIPAKYSRKLSENFPKSPQKPREIPAESLRNS